MTTKHFRQHVQPIIVTATESEAFVVFPELDLGKRIASMRGALVGPHCAWSRTLPAEFPVRNPWKVIITEPCYWTPQLPFLYSLDLNVTWVGGIEEAIKVPVGLRRWETERANLRMERERIVLRGATEQLEGSPSLAAARQAEMAILVKTPSDDFCREASRIGVALVVDLRGQRNDWTKVLRRYAWHPAVMLVLVDVRVPHQLRGVGTPLLAANVVQATHTAALTGLPPWNNVVAVELSPGERPPAWLATCRKPVVAIRRGVSYADLHEARAACDRLQADLAPEFNLAGYFVASD